MTQEKSPMESRNLCGKNVAKFRNLLAGSPSQEKLAAKMQLEGLNINKNAIQRIESSSISAICKKIGRSS